MAEFTANIRLTMARGKSAEELKRIGAKTRFKPGSAEVKEATAKSAASRNREKNLLKAIKIWMEEGRFVDEIEKSMKDPQERKVMLPILIKKVLPDNINLNATGTVKRDINIVFRRANQQDAK